MNKSELVQQISTESGVSKADAARAVDAALNSIINALKENDTVTLVGFGSFTVRERAARTGRNPRTGKTIEIPAAKVPVFKPGKALKDAVN